MSSTEDEDDLFGDNDLDESDAEEGQADGLARDENEGDGGEETTLGPIPSLKPPALVHGDGEEEDIRMKDEEDEPPPTKRSRSNTPRVLISHPTSRPPRSSLFPSILDTSLPNYTLSLDPIVIINLSTPCHCLSATPCLTYLLAGCQDGYVRAYDFWSSAQGKSVMTNAQKQTANLGDAVVKGGVAKGWWKNEVEVEVVEGQEGESAVGEGIVGMGRGGSGKRGLGTGSGLNGKATSFEEFKKRKEAAAAAAAAAASSAANSKSTSSGGFGFLASSAPPPVPAKIPGYQGGSSNHGNGSEMGMAPKKVRVRRLEPVYGMAVQSEGLWAVHGSSSGLINLTTLRHSPGKTIHTLGGTGPTHHSGAISTLCLLPSEQGMITGSWDKTVKEWDLNTGQVVRTFEAHRAEISSVGLRPMGRRAGSGIGKKDGLTVSIGGNASGSGSGMFASEPGEGGRGGESTDPVDDVEMRDDDPSAEGSKPQTPAPAPTEVAENKASPADSDEGSLFAFDDDEDRDAAGEPDEEMAVPKSANTMTSTEKGSPIDGKTTSSLTTIDSSQQTPRKSRPESSRRRSGGLPTLTPGEYNDYSNDIMMVASIDGEVALHDRRVGQSKVGRLESGDRVPPWCMSACFSSDGDQVIAGRQNASLDVWDVRKMGGGGSGGSPSLLKNLRNPVTAREISAVAAFPDGRHIACAGNDCVRLWNTHDLWDPESSMKKSKSKVPFRIVAGHHGGMISQILIDSTGRFMLTASGNRGWQGETTRVILAHELKT